MKNRKNNKKGFTIVELVIVIGVIGILSAILIPTFANLTNEANKARAVAEVQGAYSLYIQDAINEKLHEDDDQTDITTGVLQLGQDKVVIKRGDNAWYIYNNGWTTVGAPTEDPATSYGTYNNCEVFVRA